MQFGISEAIRHWASYRKSSTAVISGPDSFSYEAINRQIDEVALAVVTRLARPKRVGLMIENKSRFLTAAIGIVRAGSSAVLVNQVLTPHEVRRCVLDAGVRHLIVDEHFDHLLKRDSTLPTSVRTYPYRDLATNSRTSDHSRQFSVAIPTDEWGVFYSSGTTGIPKGIVRDHYSVVTEILGWSLELGLNVNTKFYIGRPLFYTGGLVLSLATLLAGGCIVIDPSNDWHSYVSRTRRLPVDLAFVVPDQLREFVRCAREQTTKTIQGGNRILVMGGHISGEEKQGTARILKADVIESWGNTEGLGTITSASDLHKRPRSIGRPFLTDRMDIVDEQGNPLPAGKIGRIAGGAEAGFSRYCKKPGATTATKRKTFIISDDYGYVDREGYFYISGRSEDLVALAGRFVFTNQIEDLFRKHPSVHECAVLNLGKRGAPVRMAAAIVMSSKRTSPQKIRQEVNRELDSVLQIRSILVLSSLPKNAAGKVDRVALRGLVK